jgi:hypothetical protein
MVEKRMKPPHIRLPDKLTHNDLHGKTVEFQFPNGYWGTGKFEVLSSPTNKQVAIMHIVESSNGGEKKIPLNQKAVDCIMRLHTNSTSDFQLIMAKSN